MAIPISCLKTWKLLKIIDRPSAIKINSGIKIKVDSGNKFKVKKIKNQKNRAKSKNRALK